MSYPTDEQIRGRAHELWEQAGKPEGKQPVGQHHPVAQAEPPPQVSSPVDSRDRAR